MSSKVLLACLLISLSGCANQSDHPTARPDDQPKVPVNRNSASARSEAVIGQLPKGEKA